MKANHLPSPPPENHLDFPFFDQKIRRAIELRLYPAFEIKNTLRGSQQPYYRSTTAWGSVDSFPECQFVDPDEVHIHIAVHKHW
jgi:hypothetical protein